HFFRREEAIHLSHSRVDRDESSIGRALKDSFNSIFKDAVILLFRAAQSLFLLPALGHILRGPDHFYRARLINYDFSERVNSSHRFVRAYDAMINVKRLIVL